MGGWIPALIGLGWGIGCAPSGPGPDLPKPPVEPIQPPVGWPVPIPLLAAELRPDEQLGAASCFLAGDWACAEAWVEHPRYAEPGHASPHAAFFGLLSRAPSSPTVPLRELVALQRAISGLVDPEHLDLASLPRCSTDCRDLAEGYLQTVSRRDNPTPGFAPRAGIWLARQQWSPGGGVGEAPALDAVPGGLVRRSHPGAAWAWRLPAEVEELVTGHGSIGLRLAGPEPIVILLDAATGDVRGARSVVAPVIRGGLALAAPTARALAATPEGLAVGGPDAAILLDPRTGIPTARLGALPGASGGAAAVQLLQGEDGLLLVPTVP